MSAPESHAAHDHGPRGITSSEAGALPDGGREGREQTPAVTGGAASAPSAAPTSAATALDSIRAALKQVKPPRFDRIVVRDWRIFGRFPRNDHAPSPLLGFPVYVDESLEPGVIELRKGEEVVERVHI